MGSSQAHPQLDEQIREAVEGGDLDRATTVALESYGPEILGWLVHRLRSEVAGTDAFALFTEDLWRGWETFAWRCSVRAWSYVLARNAGNKVANKIAAARRREVRLSGPIELAAAQVRTATLPHLRTTVKDQFRQLREKLSEEDQLILVLRIDKRLPWTDVAHIILDDPAAGDDAIKRESARLRKRLQIIKDRLRALGEEAGVL